MTTWNLDASHSTVHFTVRHMMVTNVRGEFQTARGKVEFDAANPASFRIEGEVDVASIHTREAQRDAHLKGADFFDAEKFPTLKFVSREAKPANGGAFDVLGDLTIHGVTKPVTLHVEEVTGEQKDPWGQTRIGVTAKASIKRSEFGMTWNQALELGGMLVSDEVKVSIDASLVKA